MKAGQSKNGLSGTSAAHQHDQARGKEGEEFRFSCGAICEAGEPNGGSGLEQKEPFFSERASNSNGWQFFLLRPTTSATLQLVG